MGRVQGILEQFQSGLERGLKPDLAELVRDFKESEPPETVELERLICGLIHLEVQHESANGHEANVQQYLARLEHDRAYVERAFATLPMHAGLRLGDNLLEKPIGRGGMGEVWRAKELSTGRTVALKVVAANEKAEQRGPRFLKELRTLAQLEHQNVIRFYNAAQDKFRVFYTMEYVNGPDLEGIVFERFKSTKTFKDSDTFDAQAATRPMVEPQAADDRPLSLISDSKAFVRVVSGFIRDAARGLAFAHSRGIIHRDVKPGNLFLANPETPDERVMVGDFGLAVAVREDPNEIAGTRGYMADEQRAGHHTVQTDVYSLGATLHYLLTGSPPPKPTVSNTLNITDIGTSRARDLEAICAKCLREDPAERYRTMDHLIEDLDRLDAGNPVSARPLNRISRMARHIQRHPAATAMLLLLLLSSTLAIAIYVRQQVDARRHAEELAERNEEEAKRARMRTAESRFEAFQLARQRGNWQAALANLDAAEENGFEDRVLLAIERARLFTAMNLPGERSKQLAFLASIDLPKQHRGNTLLLQAETALMQGDDERGTRLLEEALKLEMPPAREHFARALLGKSNKETITHLLRAHDDDPYDYETLTLLCIELFFGGRREEARKLSIMGQSLFPSDPNFVFVEALLDTAEGNLELAQEKIDALESPAEIKAQMSDLLQILGEVRGVIVKNEADVLNLALGLAKLIMPRKRGNMLIVPFPPRHRALLNQVRTVLTNVAIPFLKSKTKAEWERLFEIHEEALLFYLAALYASNLVDKEAFAVRAAEAPSVFPEVTGLSWVLAARSAMALSLEKNDQDAADRAIQHVENRRRLGPLPGEVARDFAFICDKVGETLLAAKLSQQAVEAEPDNIQFLRFAVEYAFKAKHWGKCWIYLDRMKDIGGEEEYVEMKRAAVRDELRKVIAEVGK